MDYKLKFIFLFYLIGMLSLDFSTGNRINGAEQEFHSVKWKKDDRALPSSYREVFKSDDARSRVDFDFVSGGPTSKFVKWIKEKNGTITTQKVTNQPFFDSCWSLLNSRRRRFLKWWEIQRTLHCFLKFLRSDTNSIPIGIYRLRKQNHYPKTWQKISKGKSFVFRLRKSDEGERNDGDRFPSNIYPKGEKIGGVEESPEKSRYHRRGWNRNRNFQENRFRNNGRRRPIGKSKIYNVKSRHEDEFCCRGSDLETDSRYRKEKFTESDKKKVVGSKARGSYVDFSVSEYRDGENDSFREVGNETTLDKTESKTTETSNEMSEKRKTELPDKNKNALSEGSKSKTWPNFVYHLVSSNFSYPNEKIRNHHHNSYVAISVARVESSGMPEKRKINQT